MQRLVLGVTFAVLGVACTSPSVPADAGDPDAVGASVDELDAGSGDAGPGDGGDNDAGSSPDASTPDAGDSQSNYSYPGCSSATISCPNDSTLKCALDTIQAKYDSCVYGFDCDFAPVGGNCVGAGECSQYAVQSKNKQAFVAEASAQVARYCDGGSCGSSPNCPVNFDGGTLQCLQGHCRAAPRQPGDDSKWTYRYPGCGAWTAYCPNDLTLICAAKAIEAKYASCVDSSDCLVALPAPGGCIEAFGCHSPVIAAANLSAFTSEVATEIAAYCAPSPYDGGTDGGGIISSCMSAGMCFDFYSCRHVACISGACVAVRDDAVDAGFAPCMWKPDGGLLGYMQIPPGAALFGISTSSGNERLFAIAGPSNPDASVSALAFDEMRTDPFNYGVYPGTPVSLAMDSQRRLLSVVSQGHVIVWSPQDQVVVGEAFLGFGLGNVPRGVLAPDGNHVYVASVSLNRVEVVDLNATAIAYQVTGATLPSLVKPNSITQISPGKLAIGSSSPSQNQIVVLNDDGGSLTYDPVLSSTLVAGAADGGSPGPCAAVPGQTYLYCAAGNYLAQAGAGVDGGIEGYLWKWTPGTTPQLVAKTLVRPTSVVIDPNGNNLYAAEGNQLVVYAIAGALSDSPTVIDTIFTGAAIYDIVTSSDGQWVYVSVPSADRLFVIRASDLSVVAQRSDLLNPGPLFFSPAP